MDVTFTDQDDYVHDYQNDPVLRNRAIELFDGDYAFEDDIALRKYENGFGFFIHNEHSYEEINGCFYHPEDENKPEEETTEDSTEDSTKNSTDFLPTITVHSTTGVTTSSNLVITSSTASTGTYSFYHPSQISGYLDTPITLGDIARSLGESTQISQITEVSENTQLTENTETTETTETTEGPDYILI
jgi:hypothetical protein